MKILRYLAIFLAAVLLPAVSAGAEAEQGAIAFYEENEARHIVAGNGSIYFCTRAKLGTVSGYRYRTLGFVFTLRTSGGDWQTAAVLGESLRCISAEERQEGRFRYQYALYEMSGKALRDRLIMAASPEAVEAVFLPGKSFSMLADAVFTVSLGDRVYGSITENKEGYIDTRGEIYYTEEEIRQAVEWAEGNDFSSYYNLLLEYTVPYDRERLAVRLIAEPYLSLLPEDSLWRRAEYAEVLVGGLSEEDVLRAVRLSPEKEAAVKQEAASCGYDLQKLSARLKKQLFLNGQTE